MTLLALAVAPGLAIILFIYAKDKYNKEPLLTLGISFVLGILSIIPPMVFQYIFSKQFDGYGSTDLTRTAIMAYAIVAFSEEFSKFLVLRWYCFRRKSFDEPFDGIIYSVLVGMGFATIENILYVYQFGIGTAFIRMFLSVPAHGTFAILMGYHMGLAKFLPKQRYKQIFLSLFWPILFHGTFDYCLFLGNTWMNITGAVISFIIAIRLSLKAIKKKQEISRRFVNGEEWENGL